MGQAIKGGHLTLNSVDYSQYVESVTPNRDLEILESRPFNTGSGSATAVAKDPGLFNNGFSVKFNDKANVPMLIALEALIGTKVTFAYRYDDAAKGPTNPQWSGSCIVTAPNAAIEQGALIGWDQEFPVDGAITYDAS
jgi:hypothetical protein